MALLDKPTDDEAGDDWIGPIDRPYARYLLWSGILAFGSVFIAVGLQFYADMQPCAWCTLQRLLFLLAGAVALVAWLMADSPRTARMVAVGALGFTAAGFVAALWQQFVAASDASCALTFADRIVSGLGLDSMMPWMFQATAMCDEANVPMLGIPFAIWSAGVFASIMVMLSIAVFSRGALR